MAISHRFLIIALGAILAVASFANFQALFILAHILFVTPVLAMILFAKPREQRKTLPPLEDSSIHIHHHHHYYSHPNETHADELRHESSDGTVVTFRSLKRIQ